MTYLKGRNYGIYWDSSKLA